MSVLDAFDPISNYSDCHQTFLQPGRYNGFVVRFLLEYKAGEKCNHFLWFIFCKRVLKDKLSKNKFIDRVDLLLYGGQYRMSR